MLDCDWSSDVCSSDLVAGEGFPQSFEDMVSSGPFIVNALDNVTGLDLTISSGAFVGAAPDHIRLSDLNNGWNQVIVASPTGSSFLDVRVEDAFGQLTSTPTLTVLTFQARDSSWSPIAFEVSTDDFNSSASSMTIVGGNSKSAPFRFRTSQTGWVTLEVIAHNFPEIGQMRSATYGFSVLPPGSGFNQLSLRSNSAAPGSGLGATTLTITPNRDNVNDGAVFSAAPPDANNGWELWLSTEPAMNTGVFRRIYGWGANEVFWYGEGADYRLMPNGTYYARFQSPGAGIVSSTMAVSVETAYVKGRVTDGVSPLPDAWVNVYGNGGAGANTAADGTFFVGGLSTGTSYSMEVRRPGYTTYRSTYTLNASTSAAALSDIVLDPAAILRVQVTVSTPTSHDLYGRIFAHTADYAKTADGPLRLPTGSLTTDNGFWSSDPGYSTWSLVAVQPNTGYVVEVDLPEYGRVTTTVTSGASGSTTDVTPSIARKSNAFGWVQFPSPVATNYSGEWVSVDEIGRAHV
jgi:hypothetical protein